MNANGDNIRISGPEAEQAYKDWITNEFVHGTERAYDLAKFAVTLSGATATLLATLAKLEASFSMTRCFGFSMVMHLGAILAAVDLTFPRIKRIDGSTDLVTIYEKSVRFAYLHLWIWLVCWVLGLILGWLALNKG